MVAMAHMITAYHTTKTRNPQGKDHKHPLGIWQVVIPATVRMAPLEILRVASLGRESVLGLRQGTGLKPLHTALALRSSRSRAT